MNPNRVRRSLSRAALAVLAMTFATAMWAQESSSGNDTDKENTVSGQAVEAKEVKTNAKPPKTIKAQSAKNADSYEASEEISEDLSVSYPVDI